MKDLTILLPAYNEERAIGRLIGEIKAEVRVPYELLVIDNASSDSTLLRALDAGARVLPVPERGKGNAVRAAIRTIDTPYIVMMNSDLTYPPKYVEAIRKTLILGADVVMGTRSIVDKGAMTLAHSLGNSYLSLLASILYRHRVEDLCTGMWGFRSHVLKSLPLSSTHFTLEADMFIHTVRAGYKLKQVPIGYRARVDGDRPKLRVADGFKIAWFLVRRRLRKG